MTNFSAESPPPVTPSLDTPQLYEPKLLDNLAERKIPELVALANQHCVDAGSYLYLGRAIYNQTWGSDPATAYEAALMASLGAQGMAWEPNAKKPPVHDGLIAPYHEESDRWHDVAYAIGDDIEDDTTRALLGVKTVSYAVRAHTLRTALDGPRCWADTYRRESIEAIDDAVLRIHEAGIANYSLVAEALGYSALSEAIAGNKHDARKLSRQVIKLAALGGSANNVPAYNRFMHFNPGGSRLAQSASALACTLHRHPPDARAQHSQRLRQAAWHTMLS